MNKKRRQEIDKIIKQLRKGVNLEGVAFDIEMIKDEEEYTFDNYPENLQDSRRGQSMQDAIDNLDEALLAIEDEEDYQVVIQYLNNARWA